MSDRRLWWKASGTSRLTGRPEAFRTSGRYRRWGYRLGLLGLLLMPLVGLTYGYLALRQSPRTAVEAARKALAQARAAAAEQYAPAHWQKAMQVWEEVLWQWRLANQRWWSLPDDYAHIAALARQAEHAATRAAERATQVRDSLHRESRQMLATIAPRLDSLQRWLRLLPYRPGWLQQLQGAQQQYQAARYALEQQALWEAARKAQQAHLQTLTLTQQVSDYVRDYLAWLPRWQQWVAEARAEAQRQNQWLLIVDKMARQCLVYRGNRQVAVFPIELGPNWMGPKLYAGDRATPEGRYRVVRKLGPGETQYYRALLLDYPNAEDWARFTQARQEGLLPPNAKIGGLIEIHGEGGRGADWTEGCVALHNQDMRRLYEMIPTGTPVVIVGTLDPPPWVQQMIKGHVR